jgi:uncharacterized protein (TIRG00374 family)
MKKALKIILPFLIGIFLIWWSVKDMTQDQKDTLINAVLEADYFWLFVSAIIGILSHISRAMRWKYPLQAIGLSYDFKNSLFSVFISYLVNMAIPRAGEVSRVAVYSKYQNNPFDKVLGTVVAERMVDMVLLMISLGVVLLLQFDKINAAIGLDQVEFSFTKLIILALVGTAGIFIAIKIFKNAKHPVLLKVKGFLLGLLEGLKSIWKMENKGMFLLHSAFIWACYVALLWVTFFCLPETSNVSAGAVMTCFAAGGIAMIVTPGGFGGYPIAMGKVLVGYGIEEEIGQALGWITWAGQTGMILIMGGLSFALIGILNKNKKIV